MFRINNYEAPEIDKKEILRYLGDKSGSADISNMVDNCISEAENSLVYKVCYDIIPVTIKESYVKLDSFTVSSANLAHNLANCESAVVFAATVGIGLDRLISKYSRISPSVALCMQAFGAERIEALCDTFCNEVSEKITTLGCRIRPRFSPGYGDLSLDVQKLIFDFLNCSKNIGLTLTDSFLMMPSKSVTAFIGIQGKVEFNEIQRIFK